MVIDKRVLIQSAQKAREFAYAPYSHFAVGAALLCKNGKIYTGCNVENAAYGVSVCAERTALVKAISEGERSFLAIAVCGSGAEYCTPCGVCRQMLAEFSQDIDVFSANENGAYREDWLYDLLPQSFGRENL